MPKYNTARILNFSFNQGLRKIKDEKYNFNNLHTLINAENGCGKTLTCKFLNVVYLWGLSKRNLLYKSTGLNYKELMTEPNSPAYAAIEHTLDGGEGYLLLIVGLEKSLDKDDVVKCAFAVTYKDVESELSLANFPFYDENNKLRRLRNLYDFIKTKKNVKVYGDFTGQSYKAFCEFLTGYNIFPEERLQSLLAIQSEGGITQIFDTEKTLKNFITVRMLPLAIQRALVSKETDENIFDGLAKLIVSNACEFKDHLDELKKVKDYQRAINDFQQLLPKFEILTELGKKVENYEWQHIVAISALRALRDKFLATVKECEIKIEEYKLLQKKAEIDKHCYFITKCSDEIEGLEIAINEAKEEENRLKTQILEINKLIYSYQGKKYFNELDEINGKINASETKLKALDDASQNNIRVHELGNNLFFYYSKALSDLNNKSTIISAEEKELQDHIESLIANKEIISKQMETLKTKIGILENIIDEFSNYSEKMFKQYSDFSFPSFSQIIMQNGISDYTSEAIETQTDCESQIATLTTLIADCEEQKLILDERKDSLISQKGTFNTLYNEKTNRRRELSEILESLNALLNECDFNEVSLNECFSLTPSVEKRIEKEKTAIFNLNNQIIKDESLIFNLENNSLDIDPALKSILEDNSISYKFGAAILQEYTETKRKYILEKIPALQYAVVLNSQDYAFLQKHNSQLLSSYCTPIFTMDFLKTVVNSDTDIVFGYDNAKFYSSIPNNFYQDNYIENAIEETKTRLNENRQILEYKENLLKKLRKIFDIIERTTSNFENNELTKLNEEIDNIQSEISNIDAQINDCKKLIKENDDKCNSARENVMTLKEKLSKITNFIAVLVDYSQKFDKYSISSNELNALTKSISDMEETFRKMQTDLKDATAQKEKTLSELHQLNNEVEKASAKKRKFESYRSNSGETHEYNTHNVLSAETEFDNIVDTTNASRNELERNLTSLRSTRDKKEKELNEFLSDVKVYSVYEHDCKNAISINEIEQKKVQDKLIAKKENVVSERKINENKLYDCERDIEEHKTSLCEMSAEYTPSYSKYDFDAEIERLNKDILNFSKKCTEANTNISFIEPQLNESVNSNKQIPSWFKSEYTITAENFNPVIREIGTKYREARSDYKKQKSIIEKSLTESSASYDSIDISQIFDSVLKNIEHITADKIREVISRYEKNLDVINSKVGFIERNQKELIKNAKNVAVKLYEALQSFDSVANNIRYDKKQKTLEFKNLKNTTKLCASLENVEDFVKTIIDRCTALDRTEIPTYVERNFTEVSLLTNYINIDAIQLTIYKLDKNGYLPVPYTDLPCGKISGAQKMLASMSLLLMLCKYQSLDCKNDYSTTLMQDNPFGTTSTEYFVKAMFDLADSCNVQLISLSDIVTDTIVNSHQNIYKYLIYKTNSNKEVIAIEKYEPSNIPEEIRTFKSQLTLEDCN